MGFKHAEALVVGLLGILAGQVDERTFFAALGDHNFDAVADAFARESSASVSRSSKSDGTKMVRGT